MYNSYFKRMGIDILLAVALLFGLLYFKDVFLDFLISLFHFDGKVNLSSIAYIIVRFLFIFVPLIMLTVKNSMPKNKILKYIFFIMGCAYILANTWIFYFLKENSFMTLLKGSIPLWAVSGEMREEVLEATKILYSFQYDKALVFNYIIWNTYDLFGLLFSFLQGFLYIMLAKYTNSHRKLVLKYMFIIIMVNLLAPFAYMFLIKSGVYVDTIMTWGKRNIYIIFEGMLVFAALYVASTKKSLWIDVLY